MRDLLYSALSMAERIKSKKNSKTPIKAKLNAFEEIIDDANIIESLTYIEKYNSENIVQKTTRNTFSNVVNEQEESIENEDDVEDEDDKNEDNVEDEDGYEKDDESEYNSYSDVYNWDWDLVSDLDTNSEFYDGGYEENRTNRIPWDEYFMTTAQLISKRSSCHKLHVGCVLVKDNRIIATGYNGHIPGQKHVSIISDNHEMATIHAEQNAICDCSSRGIQTKGAIAYVTHYPCIYCFKILIAAGIKEIVYMNDYKNREYIGANNLVQEGDIILRKYQIY
jgi:dCMP deaminase